jgi:predicted RND superfamily exporter protein
MLILFNNVTGKGSTLSKGALAGIILGTIAGAVTLFVIISLLILRKHKWKHRAVSKRRRCEYLMFMILGRLERCVMIFHFLCNCFYSIF